MYLNRCPQLAALILFALFGAGCPRMPQGGQGGPGGGGMAASGPPPVAVVVQPVVMQDYAPALDLIGEIRAGQRATLTAEVGGRVLAISSRVGEKYDKSSGALIRIDPASYVAALNAARAQHAQAIETLNKAKSGARHQEISAQEAQVTAARANYSQAMDYLERQRELFEKGVIAESAMVSAELAADAARAGLDAAEQVLDTLIEGTRSEDIAVAEAAVQAAASGVEAAELNLSRTSVRPAFDAVVTGLFVEVGSFVGPGTPLVEVVSDGQCEAWFSLPEEEAASVAPGNSIEIRSDALPGEVISGEVIAVSAAADMATRQFPVRVAVTDQRLKPGMAVEGRLLKAELKPTVFISSDATVSGTLGVVAYIMTPPAGEEELPGVEMVPVITGETIDDMVVVIEGNLQPGQMVVTRGNEQLYPGAKVIPTNLMGAGGPGGPPGGSPGGGPPDGEAMEGAPEGMPPGQTNIEATETETEAGTR